MAERCVNKIYLNKERIRIKLTDGSVETLFRLVKRNYVTKCFNKTSIYLPFITMIIKNFTDQRDKC
ncbi:hypothetical protein BMI79_20940 [Serratia oryzae]|jgi:hypothetical protein|uniref:Uncharacterized protein n=1 Tax=Serratia oryzae TaxID=2034155 RepID=A0A1S8CFL9_9GAMM|nr:hypothetical protein BMI79_20940 [Serratia oryzae]VXD03762.1 conserved hypothetical protein [Enterobacterales bacterium 8AC]